MMDMFGLGTPKTPETPMMGDRGEEMHLGKLVRVPLAFLSFICPIGRVRIRSEDLVALGKWVSLCPLVYLDLPVGPHHL